MSQRTPPPPLPSMPSYVDPVADLDTWNISERAPDVRPRRLGRSVVVVVVLLALFALGVGAAMTVPWWWPSPASTVVRVVPRAAPWRPGSGPLVQGLALQEPTPQRLRFAPDGSAIGWTVIDPKAAVRVARTVELHGTGPDASFGEVQALDQAPAWVDGPAVAEYVATLESDLVVLRDLGGHHAGFVDLPGSLGLVQARAPVVGERDGRVLLATIARRPVPAQPGAEPVEPPWTLHVIDVTGIVRPEPVPGGGAPPAP